MGPAKWAGHSGQNQNHSTPSTLTPLISYLKRRQSNIAHNLVGTYLQSHFEQNPADLQLLQHDRRATHISRVQDHLKHIPKYMLPRGMQVDENVSRKRRKKKTQTQKHASNSRARNKANDPLQNFDGDVKMEGLLADDDDGEGGDEGAFDEEKFFHVADDEDDNKTIKKAKNQSFLDNMTDGFGKSTSGRNAWKQKHNKGKFNLKLQQNKQDLLHKW